MFFLQLISIKVSVESTENHFKRIFSVEENISPVKMLLIILSAIVWMAGMSQVSAKCDMMKEFKTEVEGIVAWGKEHCKNSKTNQAR